MRAFTIHILGPDSRAFPCRADQTVLDAALQGGVTVPYGCGVGKCTLCKARVADGRFRRLDTPVNGRLIRPDIVYICCTRPMSDLTLSYSEL